MKCQRCSAEVPGAAQFCMKCGSPVMAAQPAGGITMARSLAVPVDKRSKAPLIAGITAALLLLALALFFGYRALTDRTAKVPTGTRVVDAPGVTPSGSGLVDKNARVQPPSRLTDVPGRVQAAQPQPVDVIDYLRFLKDVERRRVAMAKKHLAQTLEISATLPKGNIEAFLKNDEAEISQGINQNYANMQAKLSGFQQDWNQLSNYFLSKQPPQSCAKLRDLYYDALGKTAGSIVQISNSFSQALGGDPSSALESLSGMRGSASASIDRSCRAADEELASVCDKFRITKEFDITPDGGGSPLLGGLGMGL